MNQMNSPEFYSGLKSKAYSQKSIQKSIIDQNQNLSPTSFIAEKQNYLNEENLDPNVLKNIETILSQYENLMNALKSNEYTIEILNSNIAHLQKEFSKKDQLYSVKFKQLQKIKKTNFKISEVINAEKHRTKKLKRSHQKNLSQLEKVEAQLHATFEERLKSQEHKTEIYQQYKDLEEEYAQKIQELENVFANKIQETHKKEFQSPKNEKDSINTALNYMPSKQILQKLRQQNIRELPQQILKKQQKIAQIQFQLEEQLENRQSIKKNIQKVTENIKSYEQEQYQHQVNIQNLQKQKSIFIQKEQKVQEKSDYLNQMLQKVEKLREEIDEKCEEKYGLVKYLKEVEKQEKNMRKIRKIQVECQKEQALYKLEKNQPFTVLQSEHEHLLPQKISKESRKSSQNHPSQSPQFRLKHQSEESEQVQRFDTETREKLSNIIQKYENLKQKRRH